MNAITASSPTQLINEFLSGLTIALLLIPESIAFAFIMGLSPNTGLQNTMVMSLITSLFGGMPTMISGSTAAVATSIAGVSNLIRQRIYYSDCDCWWGHANFGSCNRPL